MQCYLQLGERPNRVRRSSTAVRRPDEATGLLAELVLVDADDRSPLCDCFADRLCHCRDGCLERVAVCRVFRRLRGAEGETGPVSPQELTESSSLTLAVIIQIFVVIDAINTFVLGLCPLLPV